MVTIANGGDLGQRRAQFGEVAHAIVGVMEHVDHDGQVGRRRNARVGGFAFDRREVDQAFTPGAFRAVGGDSA